MNTSTLLAPGTVDGCIAPSTPISAEGGPPQPARQNMRNNNAPRIGDVLQLRPHAAALPSIGRPYSLAACEATGTQCEEASGGTSGPPLCRARTVPREPRRGR